MNERFGPNTFERLAQGGEARLVHIEAARVVLAPADIPASKVRSYERTASFAAVPLLLVMVATACGGGGNGNGERQKDGASDFGQNLPVELFEACRLFVESDLVGGPLDQEGFNIAFGYLQDNIIDSDSRTTYMAAAGELFTGNYTFAQEGFDLSVDEGLPKEQAEIAQDVIDSIENMRGSGDVETVGPLFEAMADVRLDMENNICPDGKVDGLGVRDEESVKSAEEAEIRGLIECGLESDGACLNRLLELHEKSLPIMLKEILRNDVEHEYALGAFRPITNVLDLMTATLLRMDENYPEEVNGVVEDVVTVLECLTVKPCEEVEIAQENVRLGSNRIDSLVGRNALAFLQTVAYDYPPPAGKNLVLPYTERLKQIRDWLEQREDEEDSYRLISYDLLVMISDLEE